MIKQNFKGKAVRYTTKASVIVVAVLALFFLQPVQTCAGQLQMDAANFENNRVYVGVWLNNFYSYQYTTGDYTVDLFVYFFWVDPNITTVDWYLTNGYTVNPATYVLESSDLTSEVKYEIYRITAACSTSPDARDFPFDSIELGVKVEMLTERSDINFVWLEDQTGLDPSFVNAGWVTTNVKLVATKHVYPLNVKLPMAGMIVTQQRQLFTSNLQDLIPPIIFAIVSAFSFFFHLKDSSAVGLRLGLNTSMLVTTLLYTFTVSNRIPPSSTITIYGMFIISVMLFIVMNLIVTITGYVQWFYYNNEHLTKATNRWGLIVSIIVPVVFFLFLYFFRT